MPAQIQFFDMETSASTPGFQEAIPVTLGPNWQPNDIRVFCNYWFFNYPAVGGQPEFFGNFGLVPAGFTGFGPNGTSTQTVVDSSNHISYTMLLQGYGAISYRRLIAGDVDTFVQPTIASWPTTSSVSGYASAAFTIRGVAPSSAPLLGALSMPTSTFSWSDADYTFLVLDNNIAQSISVPSAGTMVLWASSQAIIDYLDYNGTQETPFSVGGAGNSMGAPTGWTNLVATPNSGATYFPYDTNPASIVVAKTFTGSGSTGAITFPIGPQSSSCFQGCRIFVVPAADVSGTAGSATTTTTATAATYGSSTVVAGSTGNASTSSTATTAFNPLTGYWISDPLTLPGNAVTGSKVRWNAITPQGSTVLVQTSINNGASWDTATNDQPVPRLLEGDTTTQTVLAKIILSRSKAPSLFPSPSIYPGSSVYPDGSPPKVTAFELDVSVDSSVDELVPIGFGLIDDVTVHATAGTTGSGSSTNVAGSTAVIGRGGGQTGGGTAIKIHCNDMSYAIKRNVWQQPYTINGANYGTAIQAMVQDRLPSQTKFNISTTTRVCPLLVYGLQQGGDPWQDIQELAGAIGFEAFFDASGVFVCRPVPNPAVGEAVWTFDQSANPVIAEAEFELSSEQTFNDIVVVGQSTSSENPFSAEAYDNDPSSPTFILGPYGRVTERVTSSLITSQDQAQEMADAALYASLGAAATVTLTAVPMPALEPGDVVQINCANVSVDNTFVINSITMPLSPADPAQYTCFSQSTMPNSLGRTVRTVADGVTTSNSTTVTSATAAFQASDVSAIIYGGSIPVGTTIASVTNATTVVISQAATVSASNVSITVYDSSLG